MAQDPALMIDQTNFVVPLKPNATKNLYKTASEITLPDNDQLERFRAYIGGSKVGDVAVQEETSKVSHHCFPVDSLLIAILNPTVYRGRLRQEKGYS